MATRLEDLQDVDVLVMTIIRDDLDLLTDFLIIEYDRQYPDTAVSLLTKPERRQLIQKGTDRVLLAFTLSPGELAREDMIYPLTTSQSHTLLDDRIFLSSIDNDFFVFEVFLSHVLERIESDDTLQRQVILSLFRAFSVMMRANVIRQLDGLALNIEEMSAAKRSQEQLAFARQLQKQLTQTSTVLTKEIDDFGKKHAELNGELDFFTAKMKMLTKDLFEEACLDISEPERPVELVEALLNPAKIPQKSALPNRDAEEARLVDAGLTVREQQIAALVTEGLSNKEIASRLHITESTVKNHLRKIFERLAITKRTQLAVFGAYRKALGIKLPY
ncbi:MAG: response regulator transcription factor [Coriobacteriales bacterium]|jgi:DNA-binding CsgD family transcriptional regulator|nr:response regulator transcription factor [Coriobacteriales bacterium]